MNSNYQKSVSRRNFVKNSAGLMAGITLMPASSFAEENNYADEINIIGPIQGYSPQIGTFISMLNWMRETVIGASKGLTVEELDFLMDPKANTIGAMLLHLAATEVIYQDLTFHGLQGFSDENKKKWNVPMSLGEEGRKQIKGHSLDYYLSELKTVREKSLAEFKKRDDKWLAEVDPHFFGDKPTNNYCKWFHVCEHEANHRGQITLVKKRIPGKESAGE